MSNREIRELAWTRLFKGQWIWRLIGGAMLLAFCGQIVLGILGGILNQLNVIDWQQYFELVEQNRHTLVTPIPELTANFIWTATTATGLEIFIGWIMTGILSYGSGVILLRCIGDDADGWLGAAFEGFKMPLGLFALMFRFAMIWLGWAILSLPTFGLLLLIPFYRYRFLWLVKAEHPDWSAGECLKVARQLMKGNKMRSFKLDCSYWKPITLALVPLVVMAGCGCVLSIMPSDATQSYVLPFFAAYFITVLVLIAIFVVVGNYIKVGQGLLYQELSQVPT